MKRKQSTRDYAIVELDGQRVSLAQYGPYNSPASKAAYADLIAGYVARKMQAEPAAACQPVHEPKVAPISSTSTEVIQEAEENAR